MSAKPLVLPWKSLAVTLCVVAGPALAESPGAASAGLREAQWPTVRHPAVRPARKVAPATAKAPAPTPVLMSAVYDPPAPAPTPVTPRAAAAIAIADASRASAPSPVEPAALARPRRYTIHRDYGETPDPAPEVVPTFLDAPPVDLAAPPPQAPTQAELRQARDEGADPDRIPSSDPQDR